MKIDETKRPPDVPLGFASLEQNTFEHDLAVSGRYQAFSTELLRLALLAMGVLGFLLKEIVISDESQLRVLKFKSELQNNFTISLSLLALAALMALLHRYTGSDSVAYHLNALRQYKRADKIDDVNNWKKYWRQVRGRNKRLSLSGYLLFISGISLLAGTFSVVWLFIRIL